MSDDFRAGVRLRRVGRELRKWRNRADLKNADAAKRLRWPQSKVSKVENAAQPITGVDVLALALIYDVPEDERNRLFEAALTAQDAGWWHEYGSEVLFEAAQDFVELESEAASERTFMSSVVPGLLQTKQYAVALAQADVPRATDEVIQRRAEARVVRQSRLTADTPLAVEAVIWEPALRQSVGGTAVMKDQIARLAELSALPNVTVQVLPADTGAYPAMGSSFEMLSFDEDHLDDVVYLDSVTRGLYLEVSSEVETYKVNFTGLKDAALAPDQTSSLIAEISDDLNR